MKAKLNIITIITSIFTALILLISAVKITVNFRPLYYFDIDYLNITEQAEMTKEEIKANYDVLIDYLQTSYKGELNFPSLAMSEEGRIHFEDVKHIFVVLDYTMYVLLAPAIIGIIFLLKQKDYRFFKYSFYTLAGIPLLLFLPMLIDFNTMFTLFHKITFRNDYWLLNPDTDPIIMLLPQVFFMHAAILILLIITTESILLNFLHNFSLKRYLRKIDIKK